MASPIITDRRRSTNLRKFMTEAPVKGSVGGGPSHAGKIGTLLESHKHLKQFSVSGVTTNAHNSAAVTRHHQLNQASSKELLNSAESPQMHNKILHTQTNKGSHNSSHEGRETLMIIEPKTM